jgi:hypothetical protein
VTDEETVNFPKNWSLLLNKASTNIKLSLSLSHVMTDGQLASLSWNEAPIWGLRPDFYYSQTVARLF